ncbi:MAG: dicarboxylate/amino acid:cation symporter [candidate division Zixibacteria bacterium]|nr:dicarboxylate/amino acid:cation symporter [candidate division Zixibacteria bacterium]MBU1471879.1 dicarboxylate/amino acid:cation symporter [candidate division Zixibacteria bacterium]MBU2625575.1 dicarboxylate/amino acid:cation symporter [candidate division Zixibacteria bacterium]
MSPAVNRYIIIGIVVGIIVGSVLGWFLGERMMWAGMIGELFLNALKMIVVPLIVTSMITGVISLGDVRRLGVTGAKTLAYYLVTTGIAVAIGIVLVNIIQPGVGSAASAGLSEVGHPGEYSIFDVILGMIPSNIVAAMSETRVLPLIIFSLVFGGIVTTMGERGKPLKDFFVAANEAVMKFVHLVMLLAPFGVFGLIAARFAEAGGAGFVTELMKVGKYFITVVIGLTIHAMIVLPLILKWFGKQNPVKYAGNMMQALLTAFSTASSSATLPVTMECVEEKNGVSHKSSSFVLPLGATINMDGTALYEAVAAIFIAQLYGIDLTIGQQIMIFFTANLAAIGAAGIPQAGLVTMVMVLQSVGLPVEGIAMILSIDWFLDRFRTTVNVWGDSVGAAVIAQTKEIR